MDAANPLTAEELAAALVRVKGYLRDGEFWPSEFERLNPLQQKLVECDARTRRMRNSLNHAYGKFAGFTVHKPLNVPVSFPGLDNKRRASGEKEDD